MSYDRYKGFLPPPDEPHPHAAPIMALTCALCGVHDYAAPLHVDTTTQQPVCLVCLRRVTFARHLVTHGILSEFSRDVVVLREH